MSPPPASWIRKIDITVNLEGVAVGAAYGVSYPDGNINLSLIHI